MPKKYYYLFDYKPYDGEPVGYGRLQSAGVDYNIHGITVRVNNPGGPLIPGAFLTNNNVTPVENVQVPGDGSEVCLETDGGQVCAHLGLFLES